MSFNITILHTTTMRWNYLSNKSTHSQKYMQMHYCRLWALTLQFYILPRWDEITLATRPRTVKNASTRIFALPLCPLATSLSAAFYNNNKIKGPFFSTNSNMNNKDNSQKSQLTLRRSENQCPTAAEALCDLKNETKHSPSPPK